MRAIIGLILIIGLVSCSDEDDNIEPTLSEIEVVYADLKERFTSQEYEFFIDTIKAHCEEKDSHNSDIHRSLSKQLSHEAYGMLFAPDGSQRLPFRIPVFTRHRNDRIRIAADESNAVAIFLNRMEKVVYIFDDVEATIIIETDLNPVTNLYRLRMNTFHTGHADLRYIQTQIEELNEAHNDSDKRLPIKLPAISDDLGITILAFDENYEPIPPTPAEHYQWIFDYDEAPLATDKQVEAKNQGRTPFAFDCIEN